MLRWTLRGALAHRGRLLLLAVAIVLGVGGVAGTLVLTDTATAAVRERFARGVPRADVVVRALPGGSSGDPGAAGWATDYFSGGELFTIEPVGPDVAGRLAQLDGVATATPVITGDAQLIGPDGRVVTGRDSTGRSIDASFEGSLVAGSLPARAGEVAIDRDTAGEHGIEPGARVRVIASGGELEPATVVGVLDAPALPDAIVVGLDPATAARLLRGGEVRYVELHAAGGVTPELLRDRVAALLGARYQAFTGDFLAAERAAGAEVDPELAVVLLIAGAIALLVGMLVIRNTYTIILASRTRELALLRCVGASRAQLRRAVGVEAAIVGTVAAALGVVFGVVVAWALGRLLEAVGLVGSAGTMPRVQPRTVVVALAVGIATAVLSAWGPARRATRVPPVAALRGDVFAVDRRAGRARLALGCASLAGGVATVVAGALAGPDADELLQVGARATILGVLVLGPVYARALAGPIAAPVRATRGVVGELARANAARSPRRTAATVMPLVIGIALTSFLTTIVAGAVADRRAQVDGALLADHRIAAAGATGQLPSLSPRVAERLANLPELDAVVAVQVADATVAGSPDTVVAGDPAQLERVLDLSGNVVAGTFAELVPGTLAVARPAAEFRGLSLGSQLQVDLAGEAAGAAPLTVAVIYDLAEPSRVAWDVTRLGGSGYLLHPDDVARLGGTPAAAELFTIAASGVAPDAARAAVERALPDYPNVIVQSRADLLRQATAGLSGSLRIFYGLFGLAALVALFGIVNTMVLSVLERTRELGLLRAVGMDRSQVRSMVRWEAVIISGIGVTVGLSLGAFLGWAVTAAETGNLTSPIPVAQLAALAAVGATAGVLAAALPARRAGRTNALRAIATE